MSCCKQSDWKLDQDVRFDWKSFTPDIAEILRQGESSVSGEVMMRRAKELNADLAGDRHSAYLEMNQNRIPEKWCKYILIFPGTVYRDSYGEGLSYVPSLGWNGGCWRFSYRCLSKDWSGKYRLVCIRR